MMNRFRKILSTALAGCMAVSALMMSAGAANTDTAAAREKAIYGSQAWTVNGAAAIQHSDGTVEPLPEFSTLYPGWTVPKQTASVSNTFAFDQRLLPECVFDARCEVQAVLQFSGKR